MHIYMCSSVALTKSQTNHHLENLLGETYSLYVVMGFIRTFLFKYIMHIDHNYPPISYQPPLLEVHFATTGSLRVTFLKAYWLGKLPIMCFLSKEVSVTKIWEYLKFPYNIYHSKSCSGVYDYQVYVKTYFIHI